MEKDLTKGSIYKSLLSFSIPFIIANFIQALYGAVDLVVIGFFTDTSGLSAVSIGTQVMQIVNGMILGLTMGGTILVGQYYGANREEDTRKTIGTIFSSGIIVSVLITIFMFLIVNPLLNILKTPELAYIDARNYVLIASSGVIFIFGYNSISAVLRGLGDSKSPLYFIGVACICNIILDIIFVGNLDLRTSGAALATILSQGISMLLAIIYLKKKQFMFDFSFKNFTIDKIKARRLFALGFPLSLQEVLLWGSFLVIVAIANSMGVAESAAVGIIAKVETFAMLPPMALSYAMSALAAQNLGANKPERAKKSLNISIVISFIFSLFFFAWAQIYPESMMHIFKADKSVTLAGVEYLRSFSFDFMLVAFKFNLNGFLNGCGATTFAMINGVFSSVFVRVPLAYILGLYISKSILGLGGAAPIASIVSVVISLIYLKTDRWKTKNILD